MTDGTVLGSRPRYEIRCPLMAMASFVLYALGVLALHQDRAPGWGLEGAAPIPVAVSYLVYRTPLGALDHNVLMSFLQPDGKRIQDILATAAKGSIPRGAVDMYSVDGNGTGTNLFATAAMWMFGLNISSLVRFYLVLVGISVFAFVLRYHDKRLLVVPLYFSVLSVMLLTPLCTSAAAVEQMPIGGQRYFVLAAFLPALHVFFEFIERASAAGLKRRIANLLLLLVQEILLFGALLARGSTGYVLGALLVVLIWRLTGARRERDQWLPLAYKSAIVGVAFALWAVFVVTALPDYVRTGRVLGNFWHRAFISFSLHPDWPFGDLRKVYDCTKYIPEGLDRAADDRNGHCVWWAYPPNATRFDNEVNMEVYGREYERVLRSAYFDVLAHYPRQAFELYFYVKSQLITGTLAAAWDYLFNLADAPVANGVFVIVAAQVALFIAFIVLIAVADPPIVDPRLLIFPIFFLLSLAPLYVAWANEWTTSDTIFLMYSCLVLAILFLVQSLAKIVSRSAPMPAAGFLKRAYTRCRAWPIRGPR
jgi:hypothetical protein